MLTYKKYTLESFYTKNITYGINRLKFQAGKRKTLICKIDEVINISKYKKVYVIAYKRLLNEYHIILNGYILVNNS